MRKQKIIRIITAVSLSISLLAAGGIYASAQTPDKEITAIPREFKDVASATVDKGTDYDLSSLDLKTLPAYMEESLGFDELTRGKQPISITDLNVEDLYSFTTYNEDDTLTLYMFSEPVKYVDKANKAIKFIDNTIKQAEQKELSSSPALGGVYSAKAYTNTANFFKVNMPSSVNQGISLSYDNKKFTLSPATASLSTATLKTAAHRGMREQVVEYRNALGDGVHLQYVPINNGVKENIILDRYPGRNTFNFIFDAGGYYPVYTEGESIPFADPTTDEISLILGQADARDSYTGDETDGHFTLYNSLKVESLGNGKYTLTVTIDNDFLTDPDTVYPVVIDPSYTLPSTSFRDTTVYANKPDSSAYYTSAYLIVGDHGSAYGEGIAFVQTKKMTDLVNKIKIDPEKVNFAHYKVYEGSGKTNHSMIRLYGTTATWDQTTITYNHKPDYDSGSIASQVVDHSGWYTFDVTRHVKNFLAWAKDYSGYSQTRGFALAATDPTASSKHFCSGEYTGSTKPSIIINYTSNVYDISTTYNSSGQYPFMAWGKLIDGNAPMFKFTVNTAGTYVMETMGSDGLGSATPTDTMLHLFDNNLNRLILNDNANTGNTIFSKIQRSLSVGTYYLAVSDAVDSDGAAGTNDSVGVVEDIRCYLIIERFDYGENTSGELNSAYNVYSNWMTEFYKIGDFDSTRNCYDFVMDPDGFFNNPNNPNVADAGPYDHSLSVLITNMSSDYNAVDYPTDNCIAVYAQSNEPTYVRHFALIRNGKVYAKLGDQEYVMHPSCDVYSNNRYGSPVKYFVKR